MKKIKSFTLAETIMTLFIVGLVVTASIPMFTRSKSTPNNAATFDKPWGYCDATRQMGLCANVNVPVVIQNANGDIQTDGYDLTVHTGLNNYITPYEMFMSDERKLKIGDYIFKEDRTNLMITKNDEALEEAQKENIVIGVGNILTNNIQNSVIIGNSNGDSGTNGSIGSNSTVIGSGNQSGNSNSNITVIGTSNNQNLANGGLLIGNNVQQNGSGIYIDDNNLSISNLIFGNTNTLTFAGNVSVHGGISARSLTPSDERLKNIKGSYTKGLKEVLQVEPVIYRYKGQSGKHTGVIAQDLQKVFPEAVVKMPDGYLGVNTDPVFFAMLNAMKEVNQKTQEEEQKQIRLQKELDEIKAELETLTVCKNDDFWSKIKCFWYDTKMFFKGLIGAAHGSIVNDYRLNLPCHSADGVSRQGIQPTKSRTLPAGKPDSYTHIRSLRNDMQRNVDLTPTCHPEFISGSKEQMLKHLTASPTDAGSHTSPSALWFPLRSQHDMLSCHCEEAQPTKQSRWEKSYSPYGQSGFLVALGMTCNESRLNASCHCKEVLHEEA